MAIFKVCQSCGTENPESAAVCATCHASLSTALPLPQRTENANKTPAAGQSSNVCQFCGQANHAAAANCVMCGRALNASPDSSQEVRVVCGRCSTVCKATDSVCAACGNVVSRKDGKPASSGAPSPVFHRSPRLNVSGVLPVIEFESPPYLGDKPQMNWLTVILPPVAMTAITVGTVFLSNRSSGTLLYTIPMMLVTLIVSIFNYFSQVKKWKLKTKSQNDSFQDYLDEMQYKAADANSTQRLLANVANPDTSVCLDIVSNRNRRLWERLLNDNDFMDVRLGNGDLPLRTEIVIPSVSAAEKAGPLQQKISEIKKQHAIVKDIAVTLPLRDINTIGFIGNREGVIRCVSNCLVQLTTHHSYLDVNVIVLTHPEEADKWAWARWLPHVWNPARTVRYMANKSLEVSDLLDSFEAELQRRSYLLKSNNQVLFSPFLLFVVTDRGIIRNRKFEQILAQNTAGLGATAFYLFDHEGNLPKECNNLVMLNDKSGIHIPSKDALLHKKFVIDKFDRHEVFARKLAPIRDQDENMGTLLPRSVSMFEGLGISAASELDILGKWRTATPQSSLRAPMGVMENGKAFHFDIHENVHGPHGLAGGTTGSGKSELLKTWILSMCIHYSPSDVSFVLIDFKGMSLAGPLSGLPHIAGVISNIGSGIERNMISLNSELLRRQHLFAKESKPGMQISDIYDYQKAYKSGRVIKPLSHLIIVVDEFAELKSQFPEFMKSVENAARVGRSLGVHLVLATQKIDGNVTDEIRTNARFRWCLRVSSAADSRAVLDRPDAGAPNLPTGRFFCKVGNNEVFEQVQSYWSGAMAFSDTAEEEVVPPSYFVDLSGRRTGVKKTRKPSGVSATQLSEIVHQIQSVFLTSDLPAAEKTWQDELPALIPYRHITEGRDGDFPSPVLGLFDQLESQRQPYYTLDMTKENVLIVGSPLSGKTNLLQGIIRSVAETRSPEEVSFYILDFASTLLRVFSPLNHVGGVVVDGEDEKIKHLFKMLISEINKRNRLLSDHGASSIQAYNAVASRTLPQILLLIDNLPNFRELYPHYDDTLLSVLKNGVTTGVTVIATARQTQGLAYRFLSNFPGRIAFHCTETDEYGTLFDRCSLRPMNLPGRGLVKPEKIVYEFQSFLAFEGGTDLEKAQHVRAFLAQTNLLNDGRKATAIPEIPKVLSEAYAREHQLDIPDSSIFLGLSFNEIEPVTLDLRRLTSVGILGDPRGALNLTRLIFQHFVRNVFEAEAEVYILDGYDRQLAGYRQYGFVREYTVDCEQFGGFVNYFSQKAKERLDILKEGETLEDEPLLLCVVGNPQVFSKDVIKVKVAEDFKQLLIDARQLKICFLFTNLENQDGYSVPDMVKYTRDLDQYYLLEEADNIRLVSLNLSYKEKGPFKTPLQAEEGYSYNPREGLQKVKMVQYREGD